MEGDHSLWSGGFDCQVFVHSMEQNINNHKTIVSTAAFALDEFCVTTTAQKTPLLPNKKRSKQDQKHKSHHSKQTVNPPFVHDICIFNASNSTACVALGDGHVALVQNVNNNQQKKKQKPLRVRNKALVHGHAVTQVKPVHGICGRFVWSSSLDKTIVLYDFEKEKMVTKEVYDHAVEAIALMESEQLLIVANDRNIYLRPIKSTGLV